MNHLPAETSVLIPGAECMLRQIDVRSRESFPFARETRQPWGRLEPILAWCRDELESDWRWQLVDMSSQGHPGRYIFFFDSERDCLAFVMKWA